MPKDQVKSVDIDIDEDGDTSTIENEEVVDVSVGATDLADDEIIDEDLDPLDRMPKKAVQNDDGSVTLPLEFPQTLKTKKNGVVRERVFNELTFHRLNGAGYNAIQAAAEEKQTVVALAQSTRMNQAVMSALFDKMIDIDIANAGKVLNNFFASGRRTGT